MAYFKWQLGSQVVFLCLFLSLRIDVTLLGE